MEIWLRTDLGQRTIASTTGDGADDGCGEDRRVEATPSSADDRVLDRDDVRLVPARAGGVAPLDRGDPCRDPPLAPGDRPLDVGDTQPPGTELLSLKPE